MTLTFLERSELVLVVITWLVRVDKERDNKTSVRKLFLTLITWIIFLIFVTAKESPNLAHRFLMAFNDLEKWKQKKNFKNNNTLARAPTSSKNLWSHLEVSSAGFLWEGIAFPLLTNLTHRQGNFKTALIWTLPQDISNMTCLNLPGVSTSVNSPV